MITEEALAAEIVGRVLPAGAYRIEPHRAFLMADCMVSPPLADGLAHPMFTYFAGQGGMGVSLDELFAICHASAADGVMLGTCEIDLHAPLGVGDAYDVTTRITSVTRKHGRSGTFDLIGYDVELHLAGGGGHAATLRLEFVYPRRG